MLFASGVEWRRLDMAGIGDLLNAGGYYEVGPSEALACTDSRVVVVGGGNSAGQAVVRFSRYTRQVTLLGPRPRSRRVDVAVPHRSAVGHPEC